MNRLAVILVALLTAVPVQAVEVIDAWMRALPPGQPTAAAYLTLKNPGAESRRLVGASVPMARSVEIHESRQVDGMWRMRRLEGLALPAGGSVTLAPGGAHLMLFGMKSPVREGDRLDVTLQFDNGETLDAEIVVKAIGADHAHH